MHLMGYRRPDGSIGVRNHVLVLPASLCATSTCLRIAAQVPGAVSLNNEAGCAQTGEDLEQTFRTLAGFGLNPNTASVLVVGLGCESLPADRLVEAIIPSGKEVRRLVIQEQKGTRRTIEAGTEIVRELMQKASLMHPEPAGLENLILGLECGGSDATSGLAANPAVGVAADNLVAAGGTVILSETTECIGSDHILAARAVNEEVGRQVLDTVGRCEKRLKAVGVDFIGSQPTPGNMAGGLTTIEEKSLGCVYKAGSSPVHGVLQYAEIARGKGLYLMDTPGNDLESITGMVAGGCQAVVFTSGRGTATGSPIAPVIKITGNPKTWEIMSEDIDVNAGTIVSGEETIAAVGERLWQELLAVVQGKLTKAEEHGFGEFVINRIGPSY
ncbi:MAG: UxaA family hydrolase [Chloroflexi bacterium]|nr:UxaA family hydrolase [Chloroflexota bacterium]